MDVLMQPEPARRLLFATAFSGSPLFIGGAGSVESEIRRWILENDWLEAVVALPEQMFYNTGIGTCVRSSPTARRVAVGSVSSKPTIRGRPATACTPPRHLEVIDADLKRAEEEIVRLPRKVVG